MAPAADVNPNIADRLAEPTDQIDSSMSTTLLSGNSCVSYPNLVRVRGGYISGLSDRLTQLSSFSQLAQTLCARFVPEFRPCENLFRTLTGNKELSREITW